MYVFYLELVTDMLHLLVYVIFFIIVFTNYGLPLHLVRLLSGQRSHMTCMRALSLRIGQLTSSRPVALRPVHRKSTLLSLPLQGGVPLCLLE